VLISQIADECKEMINEMGNKYEFNVTALEIMPEHVHLLVDCKPHFFIPDMIKIIKGNIARWLFIKHPELKKQLWGGHLWNPSYCVTTVSDRTTEIITEYINSQKKRS
jgi:putative transposase